MWTPVGSWLDWGRSVHQKGPLLTVVITPGGSLPGICSVGILADRNLFLLLLKRGPRLIIKTFPIFLALPSPHIPRSVSGLIFLSQRIFVLSFYYVSQMSLGSIGETKWLRGS